MKANMNVVVMVAVCCLVTSVAHAIVIKDMQFDVDGVLPSAESDIEYESNSGSIESDLYSVSDGLLKQRTFGMGYGRAMYFFPNISSIDTLDASKSINLTVRMRILHSEGQNPHFQAFDGVYGYRAYVLPGSVTMTGVPDVVVSVDTSVYHVYTLWSAGNSDQVDLYVDGALAGTTTAQPYTFNVFEFGDGISQSGNNSDVDWDYITLLQDEDFVSVEQSTWGALKALYR